MWEIRTLKKLTLYILLKIFVAISLVQRSSADKTRTIIRTQTKRIMCITRTIL